MNEQPTLTTISVPVETFNRLLSYLGSKPYVEVAGLISEAQALAQQQIQRNISEQKAQQVATQQASGSA